MNAADKAEAVVDALAGIRDTTLCCSQEGCGKEIRLRGSVKGVLFCPRCKTDYAWPGYFGLGEDSSLWAK